MSREIKFRFVFKNGNFVAFRYATLNELLDDSFPLEQMSEDINCESGASDPEDYFEYEITKEQYTGLKDINGVEIYEGDILLYDSHGKPQKTIIEYVDDMFHCKSTKYPNLSPGNYRLATLCESNAIIGNIHEVKK